MLSIDETYFLFIVYILKSAFQICDSELLGWPWVYYFHAMVSFVLFMAWMYFYTDDVQDNAFISQKELEIIFRDKSDAHKYREAFVPYKVCDKYVSVLYEYN